MSRPFVSRMRCLLLATLSLCLLGTACYAQKPSLTVLHSFGAIPPSSSTEMSPTNADGSEPSAALLQGSEGLLYGTASRGGANGQGVIFRINPDGSSFQLLHTFGSLPALFVNAPNSDGAWPSGALIQGANGSLYGTASQGGEGGSGTIFTLKPDGNGFKVLYAFSAKGPEYRNPDGARPGTIMFGNDGLIYGAATLGGKEGQGILFRIHSDGTAYIILHTFPAAAHSDNVNNGGGRPQAVLVQGKDGSLYGTANIGGNTGYGVAFKMNTDGSQFSILHHFQRYGKGHENNGSRPSGGIVASDEGNLLGGTEDGGTNDAGILYSMNADGRAFQVQHSFSKSANAEGYGLFAPLLPMSGGLLFGVTRIGGPMGGGTLFKIRTDGTDFHILHSFTAEEGRNVQAGLLRGQDGALYGVATGGGANGQGTIFRLVFPKNDLSEEHQ